MKLPSIDISIDRGPILKVVFWGLVIQLLNLASWVAAIGATAYILKYIFTN